MFWVDSTRWALSQTDSLMHKNPFNFKKNEGKRRPRIVFCKKKRANGDLRFHFSNKSWYMEGFDSPFQKNEGKRSGSICLCKKIMVNGGLRFTFAEKIGLTEGFDSSVHKNQGKRRGTIRQIFFFKVILWVRSDGYFFLEQFYV